MAYEILNQCNFNIEKADYSICAVETGAKLRK
jgi:hypothetical protein